MNLRSIVKIEDRVVFMLAMVNYIILKPRKVPFEGLEKAQPPR